MRPSASTRLVAGVLAWSAAFCAASCSSAPKAPPLRAAYQVGEKSAAGMRPKKGPASGSAVGSAIRTVSLPSQAVCRQASNTTFSQAWFGRSVTTARPSGS